MLVRMLVPKPKKAFRSPAVQSFGLNDVVDVDVIARSFHGEFHGFAEQRSHSPTDRRSGSQHRCVTSPAPLAVFPAIISNCLIRFARRVPTPRQRPSDRKRIRKPMKAKRNQSPSKRGYGRVEAGRAASMLSKQAPAIKLRSNAF
jgi:hypothetical protein